MNAIFDIERFFKVLVYDLNHIRRTYGITFLILCLVPFIYGFFYGFFPFILGHGWKIPDLGSRGFIFAVTGIVLIMSYGASTYGYITEKKAGAGYILLPASTMEKFLSIFLNSAVIVPLVFLAVYFFGDAFLSSLGFAEGGELFRLSSPGGMADDAFNVNFRLLGFHIFSGHILVFLLGAIFFEKRKVTKTILCMLALQFLLSIFSIIMITAFSQDDPNFVQYKLQNFFLNNIENLEIYANIIFNGFIYSVYIIIALMIFWRIKTIKY